MVYLMIHMAIAEVGVSRASAKNSAHVPIGKKVTIQQPGWRRFWHAFTRRLPTAAWPLARLPKKSRAAIGSEFFLWDVEGLVQDYVQTVSGAVGYPLSWKNHDIALQNIQARFAGPGSLDAGKLARCIAVNH